MQIPNWGSLTRCCCLIDENCRCGCVKIASLVIEFYATTFVFYLCIDSTLQLKLYRVFVNMPNYSLTLFYSTSIGTFKYPTNSLI